MKTPALVHCIHCPSTTPVELHHLRLPLRHHHLRPHPQAPSPVPSSQAPTPVPSSQAPTPAPSTQAPTPVPSSQAPTPVPSSQAPSPASSPQATTPAPSYQASNTCTLHPGSNTCTFLPGSNTCTFLPGLQHLRPPPRLQHLCPPPRLQHLHPPPRLQHLRPPPSLQHLCPPPRLQHLHLHTRLNHPTSSDQCTDFTGNCYTRPLPQSSCLLFCAQRRLAGSEAEPGGAAIFQPLNWTNVVAKGIKYSNPYCSFAFKRPFSEASRGPGGGGPLFKATAYCRFDDCPVEADVKIQMIPLKAQLTFRGELIRHSRSQLVCRPVRGDERERLAQEPKNPTPEGVLHWDMRGSLDDTV
ncbi:hypothetical protein GBF38_000021 [Nibea albiflora]|nr:hypothetical protein GBF38_000021 [Nibea albiflora]